MKTAILTLILALVAISLAACGANLPRPRDVQQSGEQMRARVFAAREIYQRAEQSAPKYLSYAHKAGHTDEAIAAAAALDLLRELVNVADEAVYNYQYAGESYAAVVAAVALLEHTARGLERTLQKLEEVYDAAEALGASTVGDRGGGDAVAAEPRTSEGAATVESVGPAEDPQP